MIDYKDVKLDTVFEEFTKTKKDTTRWCYTTYLKLWMKYSNLDGKASLELKKNDKDANTEKKIVAFKLWLQKNGMAETSSQTAVGAVRGFYAFHRVPLVFIGSEKKTLAEANRSTEDYLFTKEDLTKMIAQAGLTESYIVLVGKSLGLRASDFIEITYGKYRSLHLDAEAPIALGETVTLKEHVKAFPYLDSDAIPIVKAILERNPTAKDTDRVLDYNEASLTQSIQRLMAKAHIETHQKIARFHNLRKYLIDRLSSVASESQWKQFVGKKVSEGAYVSQDQLRDIYARAMPSIVLGNGNGKTSVKIEALEKEILQLRDENKTYRDILKNLVQDKIATDVKTITIHGKGKFDTVPVKATKWTEYLEKLET